MNAPNPDPTFTTRAELEACDQCHMPPLHGFWRRLRACITYHVFMALPVPGRSQRYERIWFAMLPYVGEWAYSCHCRRITLAHLHLREGESA